MDLELFGAGEAFVADLADVRLFARVRSHVDHQLATLDEGLLADLAPVRSLAGVNPHMAMQFPTVLKCPFANLTLVRTFLGVDSSVDRKVLFDGEGLVAVFTLVRLFSRVCPVMSGQSGWH